MVMFLFHSKYSSYSLNIDVLYYIIHCFIHVDFDNRKTAIRAVKAHSCKAFGVVTDTPHVAVMVLLLKKFGHKKGWVLLPAASLMPHNLFDVAKIRPFPDTAKHFSDKLYLQQKKTR